MFEPIINAVDFVFSPITVFPAPVAIFVFSVFITLLIVIINRFTINRKLTKELKEKMNKLKVELSQVEKDGNKEKMSQLFGEMMELNKSYMMQTSKSLIISLIIVAIFLPWVRYKYAEASIALPFNLPFIGPNFSWLIWYILISVTISFVVQKLIGDFY